jgi:RNA polymerase sigma-70 factor (ECF subfamily)
MDKEEFTRRVLEAEPMMYHISKSILKNDYDCADAVQEAILKAFVKLSSLREEQFFKTWLCKILIRECYRISSSKKSVSFDEYAENHANLGYKDAYSGESEIGLYDAIMKLNDKHRLVVTMHYVEGFNIAQIAQTLKIPEGTVKSRLSKARCALKIALGDEEKDDCKTRGKEVCS